MSGDLTVLRKYIYSVFGEDYDSKILGVIFMLLSRDLRKHHLTSFEINRELSINGDTLVKVSEVAKRILRQYFGRIVRERRLRSGKEYFSRATPKRFTGDPPTWMSVETYNNQVLVGISLALLISHNGVITEEETWDFFYKTGIVNRPGQDYSSVFGDIRELMREQFVTRKFLTYKEHDKETGVPSFRYGPLSENVDWREVAVFLCKVVGNAEPPPLPDFNSIGSICNSNCDSRLCATRICAATLLEGCIRSNRHSPLHSCKAWNAYVEASARMHNLIASSCKHMTGNPCGSLDVECSHGNGHTKTKIAKDTVKDNSSDVNKTPAVRVKVNAKFAEYKSSSEEKYGLKADMKKDVLKVSTSNDEHAEKYPAVGIQVNIKQKYDVSTQTEQPVLPLFEPDVEIEVLQDTDGEETSNLNNTFENSSLSSSKAKHHLKQAEATESIERTEELRSPLLKCLNNSRGSSIKMLGDAFFTAMLSTEKPVNLKKVLEKGIQFNGSSTGKMKSHELRENQKPETQKKDGPVEDKKQFETKGHKKCRQGRGKNPRK